MLVRLTPQRWIVSKFAATLASLLLIASSIGVNIARYPKVGMAEVGMLDGQPPQTNSAPTLNPVSPAQPESAPQVAREVASPVPAAAQPEDSHGADLPSSSPNPTFASVPPRHSEVPILDVRPLVPVVRMESAAGPSGGYEGLQRLPPVDPNAPAIAESTAGPAECAPYPTTSTP
jgi:hypothetical protein